MIVNVLNQILEKYDLCENGVKVQFVTHKKETFWADEVYDDAVLVTPIDKDGNLNHYRARYFRHPQFKDWEKRNAFCELMRRYNNMKAGEKDFVPLYWLCGNYCTIQ